MPGPVEPAAPAAPGEVAERAGFLPRLAAYLVDAAIVSVGVLVIMAVFLVTGGLLMRKLPLLGGFLIGLGYLAAFALSVGYLVYFWATEGATPGKKLLHLKVVRDDGVEPLGYGTAILRVLGYFASSLIFNIGFLMIAFSDDRRGLHDMIARTHVIRTRPPAGS